MESLRYGDCTKIFRLTKILLGKKIFISLRHVTYFTHPRKAVLFSIQKFYGKNKKILLTKNL